jgi:3-deoxy-7-phosphoheptulonate synthase
MLLFGSSPYDAFLQRRMLMITRQCDPMHGNTRSSTSGVKTRQFDHIISELATALKVHKDNSSRLGGVHLELTGEAVTECVGGSQGLTDRDLSLNYTSYCDPRLNNKQALEAAFLIAGYYRDGKMSGTGKQQASKGTQV